MRESGCLVNQKKEGMIMDLKKCIFHTPDGDELSLTDISYLKPKMIGDFNNYWSIGSGDGLMEYYDESGNNTSSLIIETNTDCGIYLHYMENISYKDRKDLLSLYDETELSVVVEGADEIYASKGLFLPLELAWEGICYFVSYGKPFSKIKWITPDDIPDDGNW